MVLAFPDFVIITTEITAIVVTLRIGAVLYILLAGSGVWLCHKCSGITSELVLLSLKDLDLIRDIKVCLAVDYFTCCQVIPWQSIEKVVEQVTVRKQVLLSLIHSDDFLS